MPYIPRQYDSSKPFIANYNNLGNITDINDSYRISVYNLFDDFYYNRPEYFKVTLRGDSDVEIYLPSTKKIVDSTARYLAVDFSYSIKGGSQDAVQNLLTKIFLREEINKKFVKGKRSLLTRGDMAWYITADDRKPPGDRITINTIHPSCVFPIEDLDNAYRVIGYHIVDLVHDPRDTNKDVNKRVARRQTYMKAADGRISSECMTFELGAWDDRYLTPDRIRPVSRITPKTLLPPQITALPVYLIPNNEPDGSTWGLSQVSGMEYIINALNQSMTYEDLSLVLQGLGVYVTTAAPPPDRATGKPGKYKLHPGNVVEMSQGDTFERVTGVASITPFQDHLKSLENWALSGSGVPDMAAGVVDVSVAQSGIALALKMSPIIAENEDKQLGIGGKWDQMGHDLLNGWLPAFEGLNSDGSQWTSTFGDPMPLNRDTFVQELVVLYQAGLILIDEVREKLEQIGYKYSQELTDKLLEEQAKKATAATGDPYGQHQQPNLIDTLGNSGGSKVSSSVNGKVGVGK